MVTNPGPGTPFTGISPNQRFFKDENSLAPNAQHLTPAGADKRPQDHRSSFWQERRSSPETANCQGPTTHTKGVPVKDEYETWLGTLKIGSEVAIAYGWSSYQIRQITGETLTRWEVGNGDYRKKDGRVVGDTYSYHTSIGSEAKVGRCWGAMA
jgi:hypothetical protein